MNCINKLIDVGDKDSHIGQESVFSRDGRGIEKNINADDKTSNWVCLSTWRHLRGIIPKEYAHEA